MGRRKQMKKQTGGVFLQEGFTTMSAINDVFLPNSTVTMLSYSSSGGVLFKLLLDEGVESPYRLSRSNAPLAPVNTIIMKLVMLKDEKPKDERKTAEENDDEEDDEKAILLPVKMEEGTANKSARIFPVTEKKFVKEAAVQMDIFNKSLDEYLEPICPCVLACIKLLSEEVVRDWISVFIEASNDELSKTFFTQLLSRPDISEIKLGLLFMESLDNYVHLHEITGMTDEDVITKEDRINKLTYESMAIYELWRLYNIGYLHGDPHKENFLFNADYDYISKPKGRVMMLDFGRTIKVKPRDIPTNVNIENIEKVISLNLDCLFDPSYWSYEWLYNVLHKDNTYKANYINACKFIHNQRQRAKKAFNIHIEKCGKYNTATMKQTETKPTSDSKLVGGRNVGGFQFMQSAPFENSTLSYHNPSVMVNGIKPELSYKEPQESAAITEEISLENNYGVEDPDYDKLDPKFIFTPEFIQSEIKELNNYENNLLNEIINGNTVASAKIKKGGCNSCMIGGKKSKKRRSLKKQRKSRKNRKATKN
jgi:hypothetical protein